MVGKTEVARRYWKLYTAGDVKMHRRESVEKCAGGKGVWVRHKGKEKERPSTIAPHVLLAST